LGKSLRKAGMIIGAVALVATGVGAIAGAGLLGAAAASVAASAGTLTLFGASVATIGQIGAGLTLAGQLIEGKPQIGGTAGTPVDFKADPNAGIPVVIDRCGSGGNIVLQATTGEKGKYLNFVTVHSLGPIQGYGTFRADDEVVSFTTPGRNGEEAAGRYLNRLWRVTRLGTDDQTALAYTATGSKDTPANHGGSVGGFWTANHRLRSLACTLTGLEYDTKVFTAGVPKPREEVLGPAVYDPRDDSTYPGGFGAQRINDETTWSFVGRDNPFLQALTFAIGRRRNGLLVTGLGLSSSAIDIAAHVEGANVCDLNGWKAAGIYYTTDPKYDVYRAMLMAGGGVPIPMGDRLSCMVNAPRVSLDTVTADDLAGAISITGATSRRGRPNTLTARYLSEEHGWDIVPSSAVTIDDYVEADGRVVSRELEYRLCPSPVQAAQLMAYEAVNAREYGPVVLALKPRWGGYKPGDCITVNDPRLGIVDQPMLVFMRDDDPQTGVVTLTLRAETEAKHPFCMGKTADPPPVSGLAKYDLKPLIPAPTDWEVVGGVQAGAGGTLPVLVFTGVIRDVNASAVIVDYRQVFDTDPVTYGPWASKEWPVSSLELNDDDDPKVTLYLDGLAPGGSYVWRIRYRTVRGVELPDEYLEGDPEVVGGVALPPDTMAAIDGAIDDAAQALEDIAAEVTRAMTAEGTLTASLASLSSTVGSNKASADASILVLTTDLSSLSASVTSLSGTVGSNKASADASIAALSTAQSATAADVTSLKVQINPNPNLQYNPTALQGLDGWGTAAWTVANNRDGPQWVITTGGGPLVLDSQHGVICAPGEVLTVAADVQLRAITGVGALIGLQVVWYNATGGGFISGGATQTWTAPGDWVRKSISSTAPSATVGTLVVGMVRAYAVSTTVSASLRRIKLEAGSVATPYTDEGTAAAISAYASNETVVRASETGALASSLTSLSATVGGNTASITSQGLAIADAQGKLTAYAKYTAAAGPDEAYIEMVAAADLSLLNLRAKSITLGGVSGPPVITVEAGQARITNALIDAAQIDDLTIGSEKYQPGSVVTSRQYRTYASGGGDTAALAWSTHNLVSADTTLVSITQDFSGKELTVKPQVNMWWLSGATSTICWGIKYDGTIVKKWYVTGGIASTANFALYTPSWRHTPTPGSHTYELCIFTQGVSQETRVGERVLELEERNGGYTVITTGGSG